MSSFVTVMKSVPKNTPFTASILKSRCARGELFALFELGKSLLPSYSFQTFQKRKKRERYSVFTFQKLL